MTKAFYTRTAIIITISFTLTLHDNKVSLPTIGKSHTNFSQFIQKTYLYHRLLSLSANYCSSVEGFTLTEEVK